MKYVKTILKATVPVIMFILAGCGNSSYINDTGFSAGLSSSTDIPLFDTLTVSESAHEAEYSEAEVADSLNTTSPIDSLYSVIESLNENQSYLLFRIDSLEAELSYYSSMALVNEDFEIPRKYSFAGYEVDLSSDRAYDKLQKIFKNEVKAAYRYIPRSGEYFPYFDEVFKVYGIPEDVKFLSIAESALNPNATSHAGAAGIWQFMPKTAKAYGLKITDYIDERRDVLKSTEAAAKYLKANYTELQRNGIDDWLLAMCSYNAGIGNVLRDVKSQGADCFFKVIMRAEETDYYVYRSIAIKMIFEYQKEIFGKEFELEKPLFEKYKKVEVVSKGYHELKDWAKAQGTTLAEVYEINPWIKISKFRRAKYTPLNKVIIPPGEFTVLVPAASVPDADMVE
ncbi:MAG: lytic transglycosylase domain-containing protein, partial [Candidatus Delongbacteria bacterium]